MTTISKPLAIYHEHQEWFKPLFREFDRRGVPYASIDARVHSYDPASKCERDLYSLYFNRMSPSAYLRGAGNGIFYTLGYVHHLERQGLRVINGSRAYLNEINKGIQLQLLSELGLGYPRAVVINHPSLAPIAAASLRFPVVVKANIGGSGAGIVRYDTLQQLTEAAENGLVDLGIDQTGLVQEYVSPRGGYITRAETIGGKFIYAINVHTTGDSFNLCPADICQTTGGVELTRSTCPVDAPRTGLTVEAYTPPAEVIAAVEAIAQSAGIDVGGIEYMIDDRDGSILYYDINALSNFVADASNVIGFDPHENLADFLISEAQS